MGRLFTATVFLSALVAPCCDGDEEVDALVKAIADDRFDKRSEKAILKAIAEGDLAQLKKLEVVLDKIRISNLGSYAWSSPNADIISYLRDKKRIAASDLQIAAVRGDAKETEAILKRLKENPPDPDDWYALLFNSTRFGHLALTSHTPLRLAIRNGHPEVARVLIAGGADVNERLIPVSHCPFHSVLSESVHLGRVEIAQLLIDAGAEVNEKNRGGSPLLTSAVGTGRVKLVEMLLEAGVDPNVRGYKEQTPLHRAAQKGHVEITRLLLQKGADVNALNTEDRSPLWFATAYKQGDVADLLREAGAR